VAEAVCEACELDRVLFVPTRDGAHRTTPVATTQQRTDMVRLAIASNPAFAFDETDLADDATGFTADLLPKLRERYPHERFTFIVGGDSLVRSRWNRLEAILAQLERFVIAPRGSVTASELDGALDDIPATMREKFHFLDLPLVAESATLIRARLAARKSVRYLVPESVFRYIDEHGLYR
jgi:nicotinate-nucleotide adenylyltransferase